MKRIEPTERDVRAVLEAELEDCHALIADLKSEIWDCRKKITQLERLIFFPPEEKP